MLSNLARTNVTRVHRIDRGVHVLNLITKAWQQRIIRYLIVGSWNTFFSLIMLALSHKALKSVFGTGAIFTTAWLISLFQSYFTHKRIIWRTSTVVHRELPKFFIVAGANYIANLALIVVLVDHLKFQLILSQIAIVAFLTLINYTVLRLWTFHEQHAHDGVVH